MGRQTTGLEPNQLIRWCQWRQDQGGTTITTSILPVIGGSRCLLLGLLLRHPAYHLQADQSSLHPSIPFLSQEPSDELTHF